MERYIGGRLHLRTEDRGRAAIRGPSPPRERAAPDYGPVGSRRPQQARGGIPAPIRMPFNPPNVQDRQSRGGQVRGGAVRPQQPRGQPFPDPRRIPGLLQPPGPTDPMQRLALMMAVMVLGMPQVHSCHASASPEVLWGGGMSEARICPPVMFRDETRASTAGEQLDPSHWRKLPATHCRATQSVLTITCGLDGWMGKAKYKKLRQPCWIQPAACWEALESGELKVGKREYPVVMNAMRNYMKGLEDCSGGCRPKAGTLNRKVTQVFMEVQIKKEWTLWNEEKGQVATASGKTTTVHREGEAVMEDGLWIWAAPSRVGGANLPADGGGPAAFN
jgi:hypothetical protein